MKKYCKNIDITDRELISISTYKCLNNKYKRNDTLTLFSELSGLRKNELYYIIKKFGKRSVFPITEYLIDIIRNEIITRNIKLIPIYYKVKFDESSGKKRLIGIQNVKQQIYDYIAIEGLKPFLCRIGRHQYASIKKRGQIAGARQILRWLRNKKIKYYAKLDIKKCYPSISHDKLLNFLNNHIKNDTLLWLISTLISTFEKGLSIGSYLSQFLCNLYLSQIYHDIKHLHKVRKSKTGNKLVPIVEQTLFYMDDILLLCTSQKNLNYAIKYLISHTQSLGLDIKSKYSINKIGNCKKDKDKVFIDMMGYRIYRFHITIRRRVFKRLRRAYMKVWKAMKIKKEINVCYVNRCISYYGLLKSSNSFNLYKKYHVKEVIFFCKGVLHNAKGNIYRKTRAR